MMQCGHARTGNSYLLQNYDKHESGKLKKNIELMPFHIFLDCGTLTYTQDRTPTRIEQLMFNHMFAEEKQKLQKLGVVK